VQINNVSGVVQGSVCIFGDGRDAAKRYIAFLWCRFCFIACTVYLSVESKVDPADVLEPTCVTDISCCADVLFLLPDSWLLLLLRHCRYVSGRTRTPGEINGKVSQAALMTAKSPMPALADMHRYHIYDIIPNNRDIRAQVLSCKPLVGTAAPAAFYTTALTAASSNTASSCTTCSTGV
jgi:hypothetical protein